MNKLIKIVVSLLLAASILSISVFGLSKMGSRSQEVKTELQALKPLKPSALRDPTIHTADILQAIMNYLRE